MELEGSGIIQSSKRKGRMEKKIEGENERKKRPYINIHKSTHTYALTHKRTHINTHIHTHKLKRTPSSNPPTHVP
jgi:hypothetical protein